MDEELGTYETSEELSPEIKTHMEKLREFCRVCGEPRAIGTRNPIPKEKYSDVFSEVYGIDVAKEDKQIYPPYVCFNTCRRSLDKDVQRLKTVHQKKSGSGGGIEPKTVKFNFEAHELSIQSEGQCPICKLRRSPRKQKRTSGDAELNFPTRSDGVASAKKMLEYTIETEHGSSPSEASENIEITSYPVEKFENTEYAELLVCVVCLGVPSELVMTTCSHMFCHNCILHWCKNRGVCPHCHECLDPETDIGPVRMLPLQLWSVLQIKCCFEINGCKETFGLSDTQKKSMQDHEKVCTFKTQQLSAKARKPRLNKKPLFEVNRRYVKNERLQPLIKEIDNFCTYHHENKLDTLFFLLDSELRATDDKNRADQLRNLWKNKPSLSGDECLAIRTETLLTKGMYTRQYNILKEKGESVFVTPYALDKAEKEFMPWCVDYVLERNGEILVNHKKTEEGSPIDIMDNFKDSSSHWHKPNMYGVRFLYADAVAKSLEELTPFCFKKQKS